MEEYVLLTGEQTLASSLEQINNALLSVRSLCSGTAFPVSNITKGMLCYREDKGILYQCSDPSANEWTPKLMGSISGNADTATTADSAKKCTGNSATATTATNVAITSDSESATNYIPFVAGAGNQGLKYYTTLTFNPSTGALTATKVFNATYNDYAEFFPRGERTEAGDIVALKLDGEEEVYVKAVKGDIVAGVHSDEYGHIIGGESPPANKDFVEHNLRKYIPVALVGRVHVKVKGSVKRGDYIIASDTPGVGVAIAKPKKADRVVGYALETNNDKEIKKIKMRVI